MAARPLSSDALTPFIRNLRHTARLKKGQPLHLGICVSGGPDSMALAYLLREVESSQIHDMSLTGWIVDHKARPESTIEAELVQNNLAKIGIKSSILTMSWPVNINPLGLSDFESQARAKRYDLLAGAAKQHDVRHLCLGHHKDDQVETILMRLVRNRNSSLRGLVGMSTSSPVPSSVKTFGVHIGYRKTPPPTAPLPETKFQASDSAFEDVYQNSVQVAGSSDILLQRPLLPYSKADLVTTCKANNIPYVLDPTNKDPRSSVRNAIRHLRTNYKLPAALGSIRLLKLQQTAQTHLNNANFAGNAVLSTFDISQTHLESGTIRVQIPYTACGGLIQMEAWSFAISKLVEIIHPNVQVNHSARVPPHILSHFCDPDGSSIENQQKAWPPKAFSFGGVHFQPDDARSHQWFLSRQPMKKSEIVANNKNFVAVKGTHRNIQSSEFLLWDNRYWIRVFIDQASEMSRVQVRALTESDIPKINFQGNEDTGGRTRRHKLWKTIQFIAPGKVRFTLPVLTYDERLVALPSLQYTFHDTMEKVNLSCLKWDLYFNDFGLAKRSQSQGDEETVDLNYDK